MSDYFRNKAVLVTGGAGSIGAKIVRKVLQHGPKVVRILGNGEQALVHLEQELREYANTRYLVGDIRDKERLAMAMENIDIVFHTAAMKHMGACEYNPFEAVKTNVVGTQNIVDAALAQNVASVVNVSTNRACSPISTLGATKLLGERLVTAANYYKGSKKTVLSSVRFGNVFDSAGSVAQVFSKQIEQGGPVTITHEDMTRFIMTSDVAAQLVMSAAEIATGAEIFILKVPSVRIIDLAQAVIEEQAPKQGYRADEIKIKIIGARPGEKLHEELMTEQETWYAEENEQMYIIQHDLLTGEPRVHDRPVKMLTSETSRLLSKQEIRALLRSAAV
ncbi:MAG: SDR family NAD(P)-dependent oxidoreductase [Chloroflexi bacterium]|nr:SDR family NAD(P)-dependent oxidoreductase [Chloroflexota bacterium]